MTDALANVKKKLQDEITALEHEMNVELPKELMKARAHGDLSENAEYKYAKERQGYVSARLGQLKKRLGDIGMLNLSNIPADRTGYGSRVWVLDVKKDIEIEYKLVSTEEADVAAGTDLHHVSDRQSAAGEKCGRRSKGANPRRYQGIRDNPPKNNSRRPVGQASACRVSVAISTNVIIDLACTNDCSGNYQALRKFSSDMWVYSFWLAFFVLFTKTEQAESLFYLRKAAGPALLEQAPHGD